MKQSRQPWTLPRHLDTIVRRRPAVICRQSPRGSCTTATPTVGGRPDRRAAALRADHRPLLRRAQTTNNDAVRCTDTAAGENEETDV